MYRRILPLLVFIFITVTYSDAVPYGRIKLHSLPASGCSKDYDYLQYDDGSPCWFTWEGTFRGVWFNSEDFFSGLTLWNSTEFVEFWMYHESSHPWDISDFYAEFWHGGSAGPSTFVIDEQVIAIHYAPVFAFLDQYMGGYLYQFWIIDNSSMSSGGWPSLLGDGTPPAVDHSFFSDDFSVWMPWSDGASTGDYLIRAAVYHDCWPALQRVTWGSLKAVF